jgi:hypothetical protein
MVEDEVDRELSASARAKWIDQQLIEPTGTLIKALESPYYSEWPGGELEWIDRSLIPPPQWWLDSLWRNGNFKKPKQSLREIGHHSTYRQLWLAELRRLRDWAEEKKKSLKAQRAQNRPQTRFRFYLVNNLLLLHRALFPNRKRVRISYNRASSILIYPRSEVRYARKAFGGANHKLHQLASGFQWGSGQDHSLTSLKPHHF